MSTKPNKHRERTEEQQVMEGAQYLQDRATNDIEQFRFDRLVRAGVVVRESEVA